ncbi:MAG: MptD family putative ECF transporter S component [Lachnospiraceae bacterium]
MRFQRFALKDIVFLAIMAAALLLLGAISMPLMGVRIFGIQTLLTGPLYAVMTVIALTKVPKPGALILLGFFNGIILFMMSPIMLLSMLVGAVLSEAVVAVIFRGFDSPKARCLAAALFIPLSLPGQLLFYGVLDPEAWGELQHQPLMTVIIVAATVLLSALGAWVGQKIAKELQKAGKLK